MVAKRVERSMSLINNTSTLHLTVAIPTYNRGEILQKVCEALLCQSVSADHFVLLVVDNNSTDDTQERMARMAMRFPHFVCIVEEKAGSSHARNAALEYCSTPWIAYIDDDSLPAPHFIEALLRTISNGDYDVIAGKVTPWKYQPLPDWFLDEYETYAPSLSAGGYLGPKDFAIGTNMTFKYTTISRAGGFDPNWGVGGKIIPYGEETELQIRIRAQGGRIWYEPEVAVAHLAKASRYTVWNLLCIAYFSGKSTPIIYNWQGWHQFARLCCKIPYRLFKAVGKSIYRLYKGTYAWQNAVIATGGECLHLAGMFSGFFWLMKNSSRLARKGNSV